MTIQDRTDDGIVCPLCRMQNCEAAVGIQQVAAFSFISVQ
jgi:hypothetical protein